MDRILILMAADCYQDADRALRSARDNAAAPQRLSYGILLREEPDEDTLREMQALGTVLFLAPADGPWQAVTTLWQGEGFVLLGHPAMRFSRHWDMGLLSALRRCHTEEPMSAVLTGFPPTPADPVDAVSPVAAEGFDEAGRLCLRKGTPLRYAKEPLLSAFLNPTFCFAPSGFFQDMATEEEPLFLAAFRRKWTLFTLHKPLIHLSWDCPPTPCAIPVEEGRASGLSRFGLKFSMKLESRQLSAMARTGVFTADLTFPTHVPVMVRLQEALREMANRRSGLNPLCVTAYLTLPTPGESLPEEEMSCFSRLAALRSLALLCFADGDVARRLMPIMPNVLEYKRRYGLPLQMEIRPADAMNFLQLSKPFMLAQGREKFLSHSHYAWIDFGYLRYPVYERASLDWEALCTDKIVLATVNQQPDTSMIVVPEHMLGDLCQEVLSRCEAALSQRHALPREAELWHELLHDRPDWFSPVELPARRALLDLTMMSREEEFHVLA